jgi:lysophospholipase L1-like esterase
MRFARIAKALALLAAASLAACSTNGGSPIPSAHTPPSSGGAVTQNIVGLGDSLTAGEQSGGLLGSAAVALPDPTTLFSPIGPIGVVPPTQENGWFSLFYSAAKSMTWVQQANPASSVLPLVAGPGLGNQILPANPAYTGGIPFATIPGRSSCDSFNQSGFSYAALSSVRMNPTATTYDLGIPSLTLHEAIGMYQPTAPTCTVLFNPPANAGQAEIDALQALVGGESGYFYAVMGKYSPPGSEVTPLQAAVALHPTLTTVWLGANDLLKYAFSGGTAPGLDTTQAQVKADMTTIITTLHHAGSQVIVADLPNIVETPQFAIVGVPPGGQAQCAIQTWLPCILVEISGLSWGSATSYVTSALIPADPFLAPSGSNYAYLTESGVIALASAGGDPAALTANENGSYFLTASFAQQVQSVNTAINAGIQAAATANHAAFVPIDQVFSGIYSGSGTYFNMAASVNPGVCCTLTFGGGLLSIDGLHPSDTGYALIASIFAQTANTAYGTSIPAINAAGAYGGAGGIYAPYPDPYAPH